MGGPSDPQRSSIAPRAILFDFNGVIIDDEAIQCDATIAVLDSYGVALDRNSYFREFVGISDWECFRRGLSCAGRPTSPAAIEEAVARKAFLYQERLDVVDLLVPGLRPFLAATIECEIRIGIVSGARREEIELVLERCDLEQTFELIVAADDVRHGKPDPQGYLLAMSQMGVPPSHSVAIEDSHPGFAAARAAGLRCAVLTTSHPPTAFEHPDRVWSDFRHHTPADLPWAPSSA